jgi:DinB superfamily
MPITPDTKDWTWVLDRPCDDCGFNCHDYSRYQLGTIIRANAQEWLLQFTRDDVKVRPRDDSWSVLEYACHVRDVYRIFLERVTLMRDQDNPVFTNWDQDETAIEQRYDLQEPLVVGPELTMAATNLGGTFDAIDEDEWSRRGTRSNGSHFTIETLGIYMLHDSIHHLWDVSPTT